MCVSMIEDSRVALCDSKLSPGPLSGPSERRAGRLGCRGPQWSGVGWGGVGVGGVLDKKGSTAGQTPPPPETHPRRTSLDGGARSDFKGNAPTVGGREMTTTGMRFSPMSCLGRHLRSTPVFRCGRLPVCVWWTRPSPAAAAAAPCDRPPVRPRPRPRPRSPPDPLPSSLPTDRPTDRPSD